MFSMQKQYSHRQNAEAIVITNMTLDQSYLELQRSVH
jgi:hypothetical protein